MAGSYHIILIALTVISIYLNVCSSRDTPDAPPAKVNQCFLIPLVENVTKDECFNVVSIFGCRGKCHSESSPTIFTSR